MRTSSYLGLIFFGKTESYVSIIVKQYFGITLALHLIKKTLILASSRALGDFSLMLGMDSAVTGTGTPNVRCDV